MLSIFPQLFSYALIVPLVFRVVVGVTFTVFGYVNIAERFTEKSVMLERFKLKPGKVWLWITIALEIVGGILLLVGLYTQVASLILSILLLLAALAQYKHKNVFGFSVGFFLILFLVTLSLLFLGPGFYAIDKPL